MKTKWAKDTHGFYITPLIGFSKISGQWALWIGWLYWLWTWELNSKEETNA